MNIKDACDAIKSEHFDLLVSNGMLTPAKHGGFCCTAYGCSNGTGKNATGNKPFFYNGHWLHKCFVCGDAANNLDIIARHHNLNLDDKHDFIEAVKIDCNIFSIPLALPYSSTPKKKIGNRKLLSNFARLPHPSKPKKALTPQKPIGETSLAFPTPDQDKAIEAFLHEQELKLIKSDISAAQANISFLPETDRRGLSLDTLAFFHCGYISDWIHPKNRLKGTSSISSRRLIIPTSGNSHYLACALDRNQIDKAFWKMHAGAKQPFNVENISPDKLTIVTEGEIDAMSIYQALRADNITVVATGGATNFSPFLSFLQNNFSTVSNKPRFLILFDSDETGRLNAPKLVDELLNLRFLAAFKFISTLDTKLDANDLLRANGSHFLADKIRALISEAELEFKNFSFPSTALPIPSDKKYMISFASYFSDSFQTDVDLLLQYSKRSTGFPNIDEHQIFSPGLYVIGGLAALGKTTFCWQLLQQLAANGEFCIYCSYEMSKLELFSKSVASELHKRDPDSSISSANIRLGAFSHTINDIISDFKISFLNLHVLELRDESIDDLLTLLSVFCSNSDKSPIVCLDYLQIVPNYKSTAKAAIDDTVRKLKSFQRSTNTTFIVISSFNRTNYSQQVSFESFKESGNIEYSADVVWGLQFYCTKFLLDGAVSKNREIIEQAKKEVPRKIQLCCLKNRQGYNYNVFFKYFPTHDFFAPCNESDFVYSSAISSERKIKNGKF